MASSEAIVLENQKQGNPQSDWGLAFGQAVGNIEGYAKEFSVNVGDRVDFKINTDATDYRIDIYRLGYYGGDGARLVGTVDPASTSAIQPAPLKDKATGLVDAGNWFVTDTWQMPSDLISGVYLAKLVREDGTFGESRIPFIVRDDSSTSDIIFQTSDTTWQAYNPWGDNSLYTGPAGIGGFHKAVSYNRPWALDVPEPVNTTLYGPESYLFGAEYAAIRWLEKNGYDVSYQSGIDTARFGQNLLSHDVFLSVGHDEYWSAEQRANVEAARDAGVNLSFWSGNAMFWKTRHDPGITGDPWKTLITYKESYKGFPADPSDIWTGLWRDPKGGTTPENAVLGLQFGANLGTQLAPIEVPWEFSQSFLWANTDVANLAPGQTYTTPGLYLGYEWDVDVNNFSRPTGLTYLSATTAESPFLFQDSALEQGQGLVYTAGSDTHHMTLYQADSGALVFNAGSVFWSWALDDFHVFGPVGPLETIPTDPNAEQAMVNLFAQMGVEPGSTLTWYLVPSENYFDDFDSLEYIASYNDLTLFYGANKDAGFQHYITYGITEGRFTQFDALEYIASYRDLAEFFGANKDAGVQHYINAGLGEGRFTQFNGLEYIASHRDLAEFFGADKDSGTNHYIKAGVDEGRSTQFDALEYIASYRDLAQLFGADEDAGSTHFINSGFSEGRSTDFDALAYIASYSDLVEVYGADKDAGSTHFINVGYNEDRTTKFDAEKYMAAYQDLADAFGTDQEAATIHYITTGIYEGREYDQPI